MSSSQTCATLGLTIARRLVVISQAHKGADLPSPTTSSLVRRVHAGEYRTRRLPHCEGPALEAAARAVIDATVEVRQTPMS
jgi:hypothetical protein